ncbi:MAG: hypothetical protein RJA31_911 [Actinomycetota bacterium]|jgi:hypothetical protein
MSHGVRTVGHVTGLSLIVAPLALVGQSAFATATCQTTTPAATLVAPGVCGVEFTEAGDYTFNAPSGITKLHAVVAGGGSAAWSALGLYAGGGGDVQFFDVTDFDEPLELTVGAGGDADVNEGEDSVLNGSVVSGGGSTGFSGNGNDPVNASNQFGSGGGSAGDAVSLGVGGPGVTPSEVAGDSVLFPEIDGEPELGTGGSSITDSSQTIDSAPDDPGHGGNVTTELTGDNGNDGAVYLRWPAPADSLASTGFDATSGIAAAGAVAAGAAILVATRRRAVRA